MFPAARCSWRGFLPVGSSSAWPSWRWSTCPPGGSGRQCHSYRRAPRGKTPSGRSHAPPRFPGRRSRWSFQYRRRRRSSVLWKEMEHETWEVKWEKRRHRKKNRRELRERWSGERGRRNTERTIFKAVGVRGSGRANGYVLWLIDSQCVWAWGPHNSRWSGLITAGHVINGVVL